MDLSLPLQQVSRALVALEDSIGRLVAALAHHEVSVQVEPPEDQNSIRRVCEAYSAINYRMDDEVGTSVVCLGVIGASAEILQRAKAVNAAKAKLKAICSPLYGIRVRIPVKDEASPVKAIPVIRVILRQIQRSDLNLLAAYRKIPILDAPPATVTFTRANTRAVYRKSIHEIYVMLMNSEGSAAADDRARLETLDRRETHLALVKERYPNIRANVLYVHLDPRGRGRRQIAAELPIMYSKGRHAELPEVRFPPPADVASEPRRIRQSRIESVQFLNSIPVYRYAR